MEILLFQERRINFSLASLDVEVHTNPIFEQYVHTSHSEAADPHSARRILDECQEKQESRKPFLAVILQHPKSSWICSPSAMGDDLFDHQYMRAWLLRRSASPS